MSHYVVAVISKDYYGEDVKKLLSHYDENYRCEFVDETDNVISAWQNSDDNCEHVVDKNVYGNNIDVFAEEYFGYNIEVDSTSGKKKYGYMYNPNGKWDWYQVGGRWANMLKLKGEGYKEGWVNFGKISELDFSMDKKAYDKNKRFWELYVEGEKPKSDEDFEMIENVWYKKEYFLNRYKTKEKFAKINSSFTTFAVLTDDGWYESGQMFSFGISGETDDEAMDWDCNFYDRFLKNLDKNTYITIVDCHI